METLFGNAVINYGVTLKEFSDESGLSYPTIVNYASGKTDIPRKQAPTLLDAFERIRKRKMLGLKKSVTTLDLIVNNIIKETQE